MKKIFYVTLGFIGILLFFLLLSWSFKNQLTSYILSKQLNNVKVHIEKMQFSKKNLQLFNLSISNPLGSQTPTAFFSKNIQITTSFKDLFQEVSTIEEIIIKDIELDLETYNSSGDENNWSYILKEDDHSEHSKKSYLVKKLILYNLNVRTIDIKKSQKTYPTIEKLEFYNLSNETGFPIDEIEKAIFQTILRSVFQRFGLDYLMNPTKILQDFLPIPFFKTPKNLNQQSFRKGKRF